MTSMIFGAVCSPTSAQFIKNINAKKYEHIYPDASRTIIENHYVDDFVASFNTLAEAEKITKEVIMIHRSANFELRKFVSNSKLLLHNIGESNSQNNGVLLGYNSTEKILGLYWNFDSDLFKFKIKFDRFPSDVLTEKRRPTKREILQIVMSIFDPFGFLNNYTVIGRLIIQELWNFKINWDEQIPQELNQKWIKWLKGLRRVEQIEIPRCFSINLFSSKSIQIHIFTDASDKIYSAVAYFRVCSNSTVDISFIMSKARVVSKKKVVSIPRMELEAAVLGVKIRNIILENFKFVKDNDFIFWCDSNVVLHWIKSQNINRYKPYVSHRIKTILEHTSPEEWRYVPSALNIADDSTKDKGMVYVSNESRWLKGPSFLLGEEQTWPSNSNITTVQPELLEERKEVNQILTTQNIPDSVIEFDKYSSFRKLYKIMAWVIKAKYRFLGHTVDTELTFEELQESRNYLYKNVQSKYYKSEIQQIQQNIPLQKKSEIRKQCTFLDEFGVIRARGRLENASFLKFSVRHPIILPKNHNLTMLIVRQYHEDFRHQNQQLILNEIRMKYCIASIKQQLKAVKSKCMYCRKKNAEPTQPLMGQLPTERVTPYLRPFLYAGIDYCGHYFIKIGRKIQKVWIIIFSCMNTRAIHLEMVYNLKSADCLLAVSNFINRRGVPIQIRTDNAGYFNKSKRMLSDVIKIKDVNSNMSRYNIKWVMNTPESPHMGGAWERLIGCVRRVLDVTVDNQLINSNIFYSFLLEAENIVNSRPLTDFPIDDDISDVLTPNHFLMGTSSTFQPPIDDDNIQQNLPKQFRILTQLKKSLWKKWIREYLPQITTRSKWFDQTKSLEVDDLVMICNPRQHYKSWTKGKVSKLYFGSDNQVRTVDVNTSSGVLKRAVNKLALLKVNEDLCGVENVGK